MSPPYVQGDGWRNTCFYFNSSQARGKQTICFGVRRKSPLRESRPRPTLYPPVGLFRTSKSYPFVRQCAGLQQTQTFPDRTQPLQWLLGHRQLSQITLVFSSYSPPDGRRGSTLTIPTPTSSAEPGTTSRHLEQRQSCLTGSLHAQGRTADSPGQHLVFT